MSYIIQVNRLKYFFDNSCFGFVGINLDTGKKMFFSHFDENGYQDIDNLYEFDINNPHTETLKHNVLCCLYPKEKYASNLPKELEPYIQSSIEKHYNFNIQNGYPVESLNFNRDNLTVFYINGRASLTRNAQYGIYVPLENVMGLSITEDEWLETSDSTKKNFKDTVLHETGHMDVTRTILDLKNNKLYIIVGFNKQVISFQPVHLKNGDIFLQMIECKQITDEKTKALEEIMNDYVCRKIDPNYHFEYPEYGSNLDYLCDGRLSLARYSNGLDEYYESMTSIIPSQNMAEELLESIAESTWASRMAFEEKNEYTLKLLRKYNEAKKLREIR